MHIIKEGFIEILYKDKEPGCFSDHKIRGFCYDNEADLEGVGG